MPVGLIAARASLLQGVTSLHRAEDDLRSAQGGRPIEAALQTTDSDVTGAQSDFRRASMMLAPIKPIAPLLSWIPLVGQDVAAAPTAADLAEQTTQGAMDVIQGVLPVAHRWSTDPPTRRASIAELLDVLAAGRSDFKRAHASLQEAATTRRRLSAYRSPRLRSALVTLDRQLPRLTMLSEGLMYLPDLLGYRRARTFLIAYQNNAELRAVGGFIGSAGLVTLTRGRLSQQFKASDAQHENLTINSPEPMQYYNDEPFWLFRDSNWSPDFPTSAALERYFFKLDFGRTADGVVDITPRAASDLLAATGALYLPEYHRWVNAANVAGLADYYAHWATKPGPLEFSNPDTTRKQFIEIVARHLVSRLNGLSPQQWIKVAQAMAGAIEHRDVLLNFSDPAEQGLARDAGADGAVKQGAGDYLYVVDSNLSYNKINPWVHMHVSYHVTVRQDRWLDARLQLGFKDGPVPASMESHGFGPGAGRLGKGVDYADFVRILVPAGAQLVDQSGWTQPWTGGPAYGKTMFCGYIIVRNGTSGTVSLHYVVPPNVFSSRDPSHYKLLVQRQPGRVLDSLRVTVDGDGVKAASWTVQQPDADWHTTLPMRARSVKPIPLPAAPPTVVAPNHWIEPHAFLGAPGSAK